MELVIITIIIGYYSYYHAVQGCHIEMCAAGRCQRDLDMSVSLPMLATGPELSIATEHSRFGFK